MSKRSCTQCNFPPLCNLGGDAATTVGASVRIPGQGGWGYGIGRSAIRNESDHDYGMNPITDSDFKAITLGHLSEP